ncbi:MAG: DDE-type integrase/transposase/recombinase [archaeon]|nr:DDE-type integrase/transposase/recombinase [archaeon]
MVLNSIEPRMTRGLAISEQGKIAENGDGSFSVPSQTKEESTYKVSLLHNEWICNCPDFTYRHITCKHIYAVKFWIAIKTYLQNEPKPKVFTSDTIPCNSCGSIRVMRYGHSCNKQVFKCKDCGKKFREESLIKKAKYDPELITITLDLYFKGISLRKISDHIRQFYGYEVNFSTIYKWIERYVEIMTSYVKKLAPKLGGNWHVDEMFVKVKGEWKYLWNIMDKETKFQLVSEVTKIRNEVTGDRVIRLAKEIAKATPTTITTDKAGAYPRAVERAFLGEKNKPKHIITVRGAGTPSGNQPVERLHNTIRERNKVQRGWKKDDTPLRNGQMIYYNFIRPHMTLEGKTPAEKANIELNLKGNRWLDLIGKAYDTMIE